MAYLLLFEASLQAGRILLLCFKADGFRIKQQAHGSGWDNKTVLFTICCLHVDTLAAIDKQLTLSINSVERSCPLIISGPSYF